MVGIAASGGEVAAAPEASFSAEGGGASAVVSDARLEGLLESPVGVASSAAVCGTSDTGLEFKTSDARRDPPREPPNTRLIRLLNLPSDLPP